MCDVVPCSIMFLFTVKGLKFFPPALLIALSSECNSSGVGVCFAAVCISWLVFLSFVSSLLFHYYLAQFPSRCSSFSVSLSVCVCVCLLLSLSVSDCLSLCCLFASDLMKTWLNWDSETRPLLFFSVLIKMFDLTNNLHYSHVSHLLSLCCTLSGHFMRNTRTVCL